ncbi:hypothetical protein JXA05_01410 [Candidatus Peregrinibacteria bacterium]|nr:hypothetical protein [Candidatus Peregrinibacteria bacterium]
MESLTETLRVKVEGDFLEFLNNVIHWPGVTIAENREEGIIRLQVMADKVKKYRNLITHLGCEVIDEPKG